MATITGNTTLESLAKALMEEGERNGSSISRDEAMKMAKKQLLAYFDTDDDHWIIEKLMSGQTVSSIDEQINELSRSQDSPPGPGM